MQKFLRTLTLVALLFVPWVAQGQNAAKVSEYDVSVANATYATAGELSPLLKDPEREYVPLSEEGRRGFERYRAEQEHLAMRRDRRQTTGTAKD